MNGEMRKAYRHSVEKFEVKYCTRKQMVAVELRTSINRLINNKVD
jgi:hypothetical protein